MKWLWATLGASAFVIGAIGLFLPLWPTTIFWILAALAFTRSHPAARDWIYSRPGIGATIEGFAERGTLRRRDKIAAISGMTFAGAISGFFLWGRPVWFAVMIISLLIGAVFVVTRRAG